MLTPRGVVFTKTDVRDNNFFNIFPMVLDNLELFSKDLIFRDDVPEHYTVFIKNNLILRTGTFSAILSLQLQPAGDKHQNLTLTDSSHRKKFPF